MTAVITEAPVVVDDQALAAEVQCSTEICRYVEQICGIDAAVKIMAAEARRLEEKFGLDWATRVPAVVRS